MLCNAAARQEPPAGEPTWLVTREQENIAWAVFLILCAMSVFSFTSYYQCSKQRS